MKSKFRNFFLAFGILAVIIMLFILDVSYDELLDNLRHAESYLPLALVLWLFIYLIDTLSWYIILRSSGPVNSLPFARLYKFTVSGFALDYVAPVGLMRGESHRITELTPHVGVERVTSSVILYVMTYIFSHFCFWLSLVLIYVSFYPVGWGMGIALGLITPFCLLLVTLFIRDYRNGMAMACVCLGSHIPFLKKRAVRFAELHKEELETIDSQIVLPHQQRKNTSYSVLNLEYTARMVGCLEVWLILSVLTMDVSFVGYILIVAFSSLLANPLFFLPMQLGGRERGFALAVAGLSLSGAYGVFAALITRVQEMVWIVIGLAPMKIGNRR